ncbi:hypothetical protein [Spirosoma aerolatum]|uniref:hypothetical protein n=1 Tax=Spirosoma aerolatum TaxID=1211326 RepID=UPI0009AE1625|nr:hypothetical protein [Spirosoma aerolatum]
MNTDQKPQTATAVTQEHIDAWKKKYGEVFVVEVAKDPITPENMFDSLGFDSDADVDITGETLIGYLRKPNKQISSMAYSFLASDGYVTAAKNMLKACWLGGDNEILMNEAKLHFAATQISGWIQVYQAKVKKL